MINNRFEQSGFNFILKAVMLDVVCDTCVGGRSLFLHFVKEKIARRVNALGQLMQGARVKRIAIRLA